MFTNKLSLPGTVCIYTTGTRKAYADNDKKRYLPLDLCLSNL